MSHPQIRYMSPSCVLFYTILLTSKWSHTWDRQLEQIFPSFFWFFLTVTVNIKQMSAVTSPQCHDVLEAQVLCFGQISSDLLFGLVAAGQVEDALQATVVDCCACNHHGWRFLVRARVPCRVPGNVDEKGPSRAHTVKSAGKKDKFKRHGLETHF